MEQEQHKKRRHRRKKSQVVELAENNEVSSSDSEDDITKKGQEFLSVRGEEESVDDAVVVRPRVPLATPQLALVDVAEPGWRQYTTRRGWTDLLRREWCYVLGFTIGFIVVLVLGLVPLNLNQVQNYQVATTWFTTFRITANVAVPPAAVLNVTTSTFTKLLPAFNVTSSQVKINHVNLQLPSSTGNMTTSNSTINTSLTPTTTTTTATAAPTTQATVLVNTNGTAGNTSTPVAPPVASSGPLYSIQADIALNGTRNFTSTEFTAAWIVALNTTKGAFGSNVTVGNWTIAAQPPPAPKLPTLLYTPWKVPQSKCVVCVLIIDANRRGLPCGLCLSWWLRSLDMASSILTWRSWAPSQRCVWCRSSCPPICSQGALCVHCESCPIRGGT
jgi:hypothetical protein